MRTHAADTAGALRVLLDALGRDRASWCSVRRLDSRSLGARSAVHYAGPDGDHSVLPDEDDADQRRPRTAEDDDVHAARDDVVLHLGAGRTRPLLDHEQPL